MKLSSPELPSSSTKSSRGYTPVEERFDLAAAKVPVNHAESSKESTSWLRGLGAKLLLPTLAAIAVTAGALLLVIQKESAHIRAERFAELKANARHVQDSVDRILFERYGDVQAFGLNAAVQRDLSALTPADRAQLGQTIDRYVTAYGCYPLSLVLDATGRIVATNTVSPDGRALPKSIERLIGQDLSSSEGVQLARSGRFTTASTPGALTGTVVSRPEQSPLIADIYGSGAPAWTMAFTAPIKTADGTIVGYWQNHFSARMIEDLFTSAYDSLKKQDLDTAEFAIIDSSGQLILDVAPAIQGNVANRRDELFKNNLVSGNVAIAVAANSPGALPEGSAFSRNPRKGQAAGQSAEQAAAYARSIPIMGYVGSGFATVVHVDRGQFEDSIAALLSATLWTGALCIVAGGLLIWLVSRPITRGVSQVRIAIGELATGNLSRSLKISGQDEVAQMAHAYNQAREALSASFGSDHLDWQAVAELRGQTDAISRSQAVIEFNLDGTILTANENFLKTLGYALDEIQGKHHRLFVDPAEHNSPAYAQFWRDLAAGKFQAAEYKRIGKGGRAVYIQASYNPIFGHDGKPYKVIKFATDVTERKAIEINNRRQLEEISRTQAVIEFTADGTVLSANQNFLSTLGYSLDEIKGQHHRLFVDAEFRQSPAYAQFWRDLNDGRFQTAEYKRIGKGGKEVWLQATYNPVFDIDGKVCRVTKFASDISARKRAEANLKQTISAVASNSQTLAAASEELSATAQTMSSNSEETSAQSNVAAAAAEQVSQNVNTVATAAEEMSASVREIAKNAAEAARVGTAAVKVANDTNTSITKLGDSSNEIGEVIKVITSIAQQTNLLALNATIEAARAGEAGKGFAVVANEVKELAKQTASATEDISAKIEAIQSDTRVAVGAIGEISKIIAQINGIQNTIASAVEEQSATTNEIARNASEAAKGATDITKNISSVSQAARSTSEGAANTLTASGELARLAAALKQIVDAAGVR